MFAGMQIKVGAIKVNQISMGSINIAKLLIGSYYFKQCIAVPIMNPGGQGYISENNIFHAKN